jgi:L-lactate utilization protein LutB
MILKNDSDAAYLVAPEAKSRAGGHTYFGNHADNPNQIINGAVYVLAKLIKNVMSSAAEANVAGLPGDIPISGTAPITPTKSSTALSVYVLAKLIKNVMSSAAEAKVAAAGGHTYFGNRANNPNQIINDAVYVLAKLIKNVMSSAAEAEVAGLFMNAKELLHICTTLVELEHP